MKKGFNRSPFFYVGDKFRLLPQLKSYFPEKINRFIEPFCGGGSVFLNVDADEYLLNDINFFMIKLHKFLISFNSDKNKFWNLLKAKIDECKFSATFIGRGVPLEFREKYPKTYFAKYNKEAYCKLRMDFNKDKDDMLSLYILLIYGFNRMLRFNSKGDFNLPVGNVDFNQNVFVALENYFNYTQNRRLRFFNTDFQEFVEKQSLRRNDFVYLDPPYLITSSEYNKLWNEETEKRFVSFLDGLNSSGIRFAVSNVLWYRGVCNNIFNEWAKKYTIIPVQSNYISYHDNSIKDFREVLVKNY